MFFFKQRIHACDTGCASVALDAHSRILFASPDGNLTTLAPCWSKHGDPRRVSEGDPDKQAKDEQCQGELAQIVTALEREYT